QWRPNYPDRFYELLAPWGAGRSGQRILDLGTGVGHVALRLAQAGASVTGVDISEGQIAEAKRQSKKLGLDIDFFVARAEETNLQNSSFDVLTSSQSWLYFDKSRMNAEAKRLLKPGGVLVTSHLVWLPLLDQIARASESLVLKHNPAWTGANWEGKV